MTFELLSTFLSWDNQTKGLKLQDNKNHKTIMNKGWHRDVCLCLDKQLPLNVILCDLFENKELQISEYCDVNNPLHQFMKFHNLM